MSNKFPTFVEISAKTHVRKQTDHHRHIFTAQITMATIRNISRMALLRYKPLEKDASSSPAQLLSNLFIYSSNISPYYISVSLPVSLDSLF